MSILMLATIGGITSFLSTAIGSFLPVFGQTGSKGFRMSVDFALGVMLSAVAFSLIGPQLMSANEATVLDIARGTSVGLLFIGMTHQFIRRLSSQENPARLTLVLALVFHNLPEGMGAGASLAGLSFSNALPIQIAISAQNIAEGALIVAAMRSFGWSMRASVLAGVASGFVEFAGGVIAGFGLEISMNFLPIFLAIAGGAMTMAVLLEMYEGFQNSRKFQFRSLGKGFVLVPLLTTVIQLTAKIL